VYIDPNVGGMLFQVFAAVFAAVTGLVFVFSRQIRSGMARVRRHLKKSKNGDSPGEERDKEEW